MLALAAVCAAALLSPTMAYYMASPTGSCYFNSYPIMTDQTFSVQLASAPIAGSMDSSCSLWLAFPTYASAASPAAAQRRT